MNTTSVSLAKTSSGRRRPGITATPRRVSRSTPITIRRSGRRIAGFTSGFYSTSIPGSAAEYEGNWTLQYDDGYFLGLSSQPSFASITNSGPGVSLSVVAGPYTTLPVAGSVTISGGAITAISIANGGSGLQAAVVTIAGNGTNAAFVATVTGGAVTALTRLCGGSGYSGSPTVTITPVLLSGATVTVTYAISLNAHNVGDNEILQLNYVSASDGACYIYNPWVFAPGDTITRANQYAVDDNVITKLTTPNGNGPATIRWMGPLGGPTDVQTIDPTDIINPNTWSWAFPWNYPGPPIEVSQVPPNGATFSGTTTAGSPVVTGIANTATLSIGQPVVGDGIPGLPFVPASRTTIVEINNANSITLSANANLTGTFTLSSNPTPAGTVAFNYLRFYNTNPANGTYAWSSPNIYTAENWAVSGTDSFGPYFAIGNGPEGANDNGLYLAYGDPTKNYGVLELVSNLPHGLKTGQTITNCSNSNWGFSGNISSGLPTVTGITGSPPLFVNQIVTGSGIPFGTYIETINSSSEITLSANATATTTGASLTVHTSIPWSISGLAPMYGSDSGGIGINGINGAIWVTGPNTVAVYCQAANGLSGTTLQTVNSTSEVPCYLLVSFPGTQMQTPVEYAASAVSNWKNTILHLNIPWASSDATVASYAQRVAAHIGPTNPINIEMGNEHWNYGQNLEPLWEEVHANLMQYFPVGTNLYPHYTPTRSVVSYTATGAAFPDFDYAYALRAANKHYVFCKAFAAAGGNSSLVKLLYGGLYSNNGASYHNSGMATAAVEYQLPQDYIAVAPYMSGPTNAPVLAANYPAGYAGNASNGNWSVDAINDFCRHYMYYGQTNVTVWSTLASQLTGTTLQIMCYEGSIQLITQKMPLNDYVNQDAFHHPSFYDLLWGYLLAQQNGNYNVAGTGVTLMNYFTIFFNGITSALWKLGDSASQAKGRGLTNQYMTPQGGLPGTGNPYGYYQTNQAVALQAWTDWISYAPVPPPSPTKSTRRWFSGLAGPHVRITS